MAQTTLPNSHYTVAWICALPEERIAGDAMLDVTHSGPSEVHPDDNNTYQLGRIGKHNIAIVCLPLGCYGTVNAAIVATQMKFTFPSLKIYLMVGIGGGIPSASHDIRLGDIVVSKPENNLGGVVQYDLGKTVKEGHFERSGSLNKPPQLLLNAIAGLKASHGSGRGVDNISDYMSEVHTKRPHLAENYIYQGQDNDTLYKADYEHKDGATCEPCLDSELIPREPRNNIRPVIHYGIIASGNQVIKHGMTRDRIGNDSGAICFEMEAAGLMDHCPCLVIRGICDYSDSHKNKRWQPYAALAAAAYAKELLCQITPFGGTSMQPTPLNNNEQIFDIPRILHPHFSGRQKYLDQISDFFHCQPTSQEGAIVSIFGIPGVGKSQLTLKYALENKNKYNYGFYTIANTPSHWLSSCDSIVQGLCLPEVAYTEQNQRRQALKKWLSAKRSWILIIDDVTPSVVDLLRDTLPQHFGGHILLSTRDRYIAQEFSSPESCIHLHEMNPAEGKELVLKIYNRQEDDTEVAEKISRELGGLPLALEQGTTCAVQRHWDLDTLFQNLRENKQAMMGGILENPHHSDLITTLDIALMTLEPAHVALLNLMLMMHPQALPLQILIDGAPNLEYKADHTNASDDKQSTTSQGSREWMLRFRNRFKAFKGSKVKSASTGRKSPARTAQLEVFNCLKGVLTQKLELDKAIVVLEKSSLVRRTENGDIWIHDLFKELLQKKLEEEERKELVQYAGQIICLAFPQSSYKTWNICSSYLPHSLEVMALLENYDLHTLGSANAMYGIGSYYYENSRYTEAIKLFEQTLAVEEKFLGENHISALGTISNIARAFRRQGRYDESLQLSQKVLVEMEKTKSSKYHLRIRRAVENIALIYRRQKRYNEAVQMLQQLLTACENNQEFGKDDEETIRVADSLALVLVDQDKPDEATKLYERVLAGREKILGKEHPLTLQTLYKLSVALSRQGRYDESIQLAKRALIGRERVLGKNHRATIKTASQLIRVLCLQGKKDEASQVFEQALAGTEGSLAGENSESFIGLRSVANALVDIGKYDEALRFFQRALAGVEETMGKTHHLTRRTAKELQALTKTMSAVV
ncbi:hypothetical protein TWF281_010448 [Arthrobotrys megalospora]